MMRRLNFWHIHNAHNNKYYLTRILLDNPIILSQDRKYVTRFVVFLDALLTCTSSYSINKTISCLGSKCCYCASKIKRKWSRGFINWKNMYWSEDAIIHWHPLVFVFYTLSDRWQRHWWAEVKYQPTVGWATEGTKLAYRTKTNRE